MKTFQELTHEERTLAVNQMLAAILEGVVSGELRFAFDDADALQDRLDRAKARAVRARSPHLAHEYIMETCSVELTALAVQVAFDGVYTVDGEHVVKLNYRPVAC